MNKTELAQKIKELEGLSNEEKCALLELLHSQKKYGLVWEDKPEEAEQKMLDHLPVLKEVPDRAIISDNPDAPNHLLIEGDNLEALTALSYTHEGKIDVIYIDPPYNTGNKDFVYNDSYVDSEDSYRHSKWLSFMSRRLRIAKRLLSKRGVIFISIDDNEQAALKLLCDEIFSQENFIGSLPRVTKKSGKAHSEDIARNHDYVLIYSKQHSLTLRGIQSDAKGFDNIDEYVCDRGKYKVNQTLDYDSLWYNPAMDFPLVVDGITYFPGGDEKAHIDRHNGIHNPKDWVWRWSKAKFEFGLKNGFVIFKRGRNGIRIYTKTYLNASIEKDAKGEYYVAYKDRETKMSSLALVENEFSNDNAKKELGNYLDANAFDFPKPSSLIVQLVYLSTNRNCTVLDFFAGSGTTLHAVMQLNAEDDGKRLCILCTNNENCICENVTYERNKRVINGNTKPNGEFVEGLHDNNLRYYRSELLPSEPTIKNMKELVRAATGLLCIKNDLYTEAPFGGRKLNPNVARYFEQGDKRMLVIYNEQAIPFIAKIIAEMPDEEKIKVYVFAYGSDPYEADFAEVKDRVTLCALPDAIYNAYKKVLPKRKPKFSPDDIVEEIIEEEADTAPEGTLDFNNGYEQEGGDQ